MQIEINLLKSGAYPDSLADLDDRDYHEDLCDPRSAEFHFSRIPCGGFEVYSKFLEEVDGDASPRLYWGFRLEYGSQG